jgi:hypothetical protein
LKIAKSFVALLFSFALLAGQFSFAMPQPSAEQAKSCCGKHCCCAPSNNSESAPLPVVPTQNSSQDNWQLAASVAHHLIAFVSTPEEPVIAAHNSVSIPSAVPLYQRHCSFLI